MIFSLKHYYELSLIWATTRTKIYPGSFLVFGTVSAVNTKNNFFFLGILIKVVFKSILLKFIRSGLEE